jgi:hypothetical protein
MYSIVFPSFGLILIKAQKTKLRQENINKYVCNVTLHGQS